MKTVTATIVYTEKESPRQYKHTGEWDEAFFEELAAVQVFIIKHGGEIVGVAYRENNED